MAVVNHKLELQNRIKIGSCSYLNGSCSYLNSPCSYLNPLVECSYLNGTRTTMEGVIDRMHSLFRALSAFVNHTLELDKQD